MVDLESEVSLNACNVVAYETKFYYVQFQTFLLLHTPSTYIKNTVPLRGYVFITMFTSWVANGFNTN